MYTTDNLKWDGNVNKLIQLDKGLRVLRILRSSLTYFAKMQERLVWYDLSAGLSYMVLFIISCRIKVDISVEYIE